MAMRSSVRRVGSDDPNPNPRIGKIVTYTLVGAVIGGYLMYTTAPGQNTSCVGCDDVHREKRMVTGALVGGGIGLGIGVLVAAGGDKPKLSARRMP